MWNGSEGLLAKPIIGEEKALCWLPGEVQHRTVFALIVTAASGNTISQRYYEALPQQATLRPAGNMMGGRK